MGEVTVTVGWRNYRLDCPDGAEDQTIEAAKILSDQVDHVRRAMHEGVAATPEKIVLLYAGLILADRALVAGVDSPEARIKALELQVATAAIELQDAAAAVRKLASRLNAERKERQLAARVKARAIRFGALDRPQNVPARIHKRRPAPRAAKG